MRISVIKDNIEGQNSESSYSCTLSCIINKLEVLLNYFFDFYN